LGYHSILLPNKKAVQITAFDKSRNGLDQGNSYTPQDIREYGQGLCAFLRIPTLTKYREKLVWYSKKGEKGRNTELSRYFQNPQIALIISLMLCLYD